MEKKFEGAAWVTADNPHRPVLALGHLPGRKSVCLYGFTEEGLDVFAHFRKEEDALEVLNRLRKLISMQPTRTELRK